EIALPTNIWASIPSAVPILGRAIQRTSDARLVTAPRSFSSRSLSTQTPRLFVPARLGAVRESPDKTDSGEPMNSMITASSVIGLGRPSTASFKRHAQPHDLGIHRSGEGTFCAGYVAGPGNITTGGGGGE